MHMYILNVEFTRGVGIDSAAERLGRWLEARQKYKHVIWAGDVSEKVSGAGTGNEYAESYTTGNVMRATQASH